MDYETYSKLKKGNRKAVEALINEHSKRAWFLCYHITQNTCTAAPLFIAAWRKSITQAAQAPSPPKENFSDILFSNILALSRGDLEYDGDYQPLPPPKAAPRYERFVKEFGLVAEQRRPAYLIHTYGGVGIKRIAEILETSPEQVAQDIKAAEEEIAEKSETLPKNKRAEKVRLFTQFRDPSGSGFNEVAVPELLQTALYHKLNLTAQKPASRQRKEKKGMAEKTVSPAQGGKTAARKSAKKKKIIIAAAAALALVILGVLFLPRLLGMSTAAATSITTYQVEAVTYGDVNTTISGSGTLSPVSQTTLSNAEPATVTAVNYAVGDTVAAGEVIATVESAGGASSSYAAPYDCVLIELPIAAGDELAANSEIAMVMGTDGFTMDIAVDELDISSVKTGQEVTFTIDAVDGSYTGAVTAISYNGSSSGGATAYQITATVDYVEGVYPGMSASAEIVVESSGDGLLVPVNAVQTSGDDNYVYLAPADATEGAEYAENEIDVSGLTRVTVETGMSDGSYILIESGELAQGSLIVIPTLTSTMTGSDSQDNNAMGGMGGGPGGMGGGMDFGDFDFENFDPGNAPQGGGIPGGGN